MIVNGVSLTTHVPITPMKNIEKLHTVYLHLYKPML